MRVAQMTNPDRHPVAGALTNTRRVRVWFGEHIVADYEAEPERAALYQDAMQRRFAGLRVTNEALPTASPVAPATLPNEWLWELTP